jgi:hypothetical protein
MIESRVCLATLLFGALLAGCGGQVGLLTPGDSRHELPPYAPEQLSDARMAAVRRFAPVILQPSAPDTHRESWDVPTAVDFDGDPQTRNNFAALKAGDVTLTATLYYALVETETHRFITYHAYHPVDWTRAPNFLWSGIWHRNDGQSVLVVTRKTTAPRDERVVAMVTQHHTSSSLYVASGAGLDAGTWKPRGGVVLLDDAGREGGSGSHLTRTHPAVFSERGKHALYGLASHRADVTVGAQPRPQNGLVLLPDPLGRGEDWLPGARTLRYRLLPVHDTHWRMYRRRKSLGDGGVMDGTFDYRDDGATYRNLPRHYDGDRLVLLWTWRCDAGITPFAQSHSLLAGDLGALFFAPAEKLKRSLGEPQDWALDYIYNPYRPAPGDGAKTRQMGH